jgi:hypothetical protein
MTAAPTTNTAAQRAAALLDGNSVRSRRAELKRDLRQNPDTAGVLLGRLLVDPPGYLSNALTLDVLTYLRGVKFIRAEAILDAADVTEGLRTVAELTGRERQAIADLIETPQTIPAVRRARRRPVRQLVAAPILDDIAI